MRVQSVPAVLDELHGLPYVATLKCDGTSATFCIDLRDGAFHTCGRNFSILEGDSMYWRIARKYDSEGVLRRLPHLAVQGEVCGPGIQKNRLGLKDLAMCVFNVYVRRLRATQSNPQNYLFLRYNRDKIAFGRQDGRDKIHAQPICSC